MSYMFQTPVLLITFNRPNHTRFVLEAIRKKQPRFLFVFQDGARTDNKDDLSKCTAVRDLIDELVDWDCELKKYYSDINLGCGPGPASGISWFFDQVEQGIIIEDDAVPGYDFFEYAEELLNRYKDKEEIRAISSMKVDIRMYGKASYYFSMMNRTLCAWATWKRAWVDFDLDLRSLSKTELYGALNKYGVTFREREYWYERLLEIQKDGLRNSSWDQQFWISIWLKSGKGICPNVNLSSNVGFDQEATHTFCENNIAANIQTESILPLTHPTSTVINRKADLRFHKLYFDSIEYGWIGFKRIPHRLNKRIKRMLRKEGSWFKKR